MKFKKLAALTGSALMAGLAIAAPVMAASVASLGEVEDMVSVTDSTVDFPIFVIGESAASSDVAGAVDVAVKFAANAKTTVDVETPTAVESVSGGVKVETVGNKFTPWQAIGNVKNVLTASDLTMMADGVYQPASGASYTYRQYLYLGGESPPTTCSASSCTTPHIEFTRPTGENAPRLSFKAPLGQTIYTYKLTFTTPVSLSGITQTADLTATISGTSLSIMGKPFVVSDATWSSGISDMTLLGGGTTATVETGQDTSVSFGGKEYVAHLDSVAAETISGSTYYSAIGNVNGESFQLRAGQTKTLSDGTTVGAIKVFAPIVSGQAGYASLTVGGEKIKLYSSGTVTKGTKSISGLTSTIISSSTAWSSISVTYAPTEDIFLAEGGEVEDKFVGGFDLKFNSFQPAIASTSARQAIGLTPSGNNMILTYKNAAGSEETVYALYMNSSALAAGNQLWGYAAVSGSGSDNGFRDMVFDEGATISAIDQDYFVISFGGFSHVMRFTGFDVSNNLLTFEDEKGETMNVYNTSATAAQIIVDGNAYSIYISDATDKKILVDLNKDGKFGSAATGASAVAGTEFSYLVPKLITSGQGGLYFYKGESAYAATGGGTPLYPSIGVWGLRYYNASAIGNTATAVVTFEEYVAGGTWSHVANLTMAGNTSAGSDATQTSALSNYIDVFLSCYDSTDGAAATTPTCKVGLGTTVGYGYPGFVLVEEALQGSTTHNWIYVPVNYTTQYLRTMVTTPMSDDTNAVTGTSWGVTVIGTTGAAKGMSTYGTMVDYDTVAGTGSLSYPDSFSYGNVYVLGSEAVITSAGGTGTVTTENVLPITADVVYLDNEAGLPKTTKDLVLMGGPCANDLVQELADDGSFPYGCDDWPGRDFGRVEIVADAFASGKMALVIAGTRAGDTDLAARVVQLGFPGATDSQKAGTSIEVTGSVSSPAYA